MMMKWLVILAAAPLLAAQSQTESVEKAVLAVSAKMTQAGQDRDADLLFRYIASNDRGSIVQNGNLMLTREQALEQVKGGFERTPKVEYRWKRQLVTVVSPTVALLVSEGEAEATTGDGRTFVTPLAQTMVFVLAGGEGKVLLAHQSSPVRR
jgi:hypothetical protein